MISLWNLTGTSATIRKVYTGISRLRASARFGDKTSYRLVNRGPTGWLCTKPTLKRKGHHDDSLDIHWRCWRQASTSPVNIKAVILTTFPFLWTCTKPNQNIPDSKVHRANMGPTWVLSLNGPHVGPMNLAIRDLKHRVHDNWDMLCMVS